MKHSQTCHQQPSRCPHRTHRRIIRLPRLKEAPSRVFTSHLRDITSIVHGLLHPHHALSLLTCDTLTRQTCETWTPGCECPASSLVALSPLTRTGLWVYLSTYCAYFWVMSFFGFYDGPYAFKCLHLTTTTTTTIVHAVYWWSRGKRLHCSHEPFCQRGFTGLRVLSTYLW